MWPPLRADQERARALYLQEFGPQAAARNATGGRDLGANVIGDKPDRSPGDTSDLPPTGQELLDMEDDENDSRLDKFRDEYFKEFGDVVDAGNNTAETFQNILERPPPTGHPEVAVNAGPVIGPEAPQHATVDVGSAAELLMVAGVLGFQAGRWVHHKIEARRR